MGYLFIDGEITPDGTTHRAQEFDTVSCKHCQAVIRLVKRQRQGAWCCLCNGPVCNTNRCASRCVPFFMKIDKWQRGEALSRAVGLAT